MALLLDIGMSLSTAPAAVVNCSPDRAKKKQTGLFLNRLSC